MNNKRLLFLGMVALTLGVGVIIGTIVLGGVKATFEQKPTAIVIPDPVSLSNAFSQIAAQLDPVVVKIEVDIAPSQTTRNRQQGGRQVPQIPGLPPGFFDFAVPDEGPQERGGKATGTGFIVDKAGYILTNHHVIERASKITVVLSDDSKHVAKTIGGDEATDLGLIKIDAGHELQTAKFGNSDSVKVGDWVLAIGSPFGFDHTVTSGIISAKGRDNTMQQFSADRKNGGLQRFLQTDAAINPGNSGGPLVNMAGEVIGVNTAIVSETNSFAGLGFALPSNTAVKVYNQLSQHGKVTRGWIGILYGSETDPTILDSYCVKSKESVIVSDVYPESPAAKAGIRKDDVITEIDGMKLTNGNQLLDYIVDRSVGSTVKVGLLRECKAQTVSLTIGDRTEGLASEAVTSNNGPQRNIPRGGSQSEVESRLGMQVQPIRSQLSRQFDLSGGVEISHVNAGSSADEADLEEGMVITGMVTGGRPTAISNVEDFRRFESSLKSGTSLTLKVRTARTQFQVEEKISIKVK